jgi:hypothetical protein
VKPLGSVFEQTYHAYLAQIRGLDLRERAAPLGAGLVTDGLVIPFYGEPHHITAQGLFRASGAPANFAVSVVLCRYVLQCPAQNPPDGGWVTYREFKNAGPLVGYFTANTNKIIETSFSGRRADLPAAAARLGARPFADGSAHDLSLQFDMLPRVPVLLRFNDRDDEFPAQSAVLFRESAEAYLDMESLAIGGTFLAGRLTRPNAPPSAAHA